MTHEELKAKALLKSNVRAEFEALESEFTLLREIFIVRKHSSLKQASKPQFIKKMEFKYE